mmetsp:Transcript_14830/g.20325  ORF Transcript_14830/g.20325 Transcript_14830/m.20325 type:complete len:338 (+) Transcript_14830:118-1131(+)
MVELSYQGLYFCTTNQRSDLVELEEKSSLQDYYTEKRRLQSVNAIHESFTHYFMDRMPSTAQLSSEMQVLCDGLDSFAKRFGMDVETLGSRNEEEAEKQLEKEAEKELLRECQLPVLTARTESDWSYDALLDVATRSSAWSDICAAISTRIKPLSSVVKTSVASALKLSALPWTAVKIFCTANYTQTVAEKTESFQEYLRFTDACLYFPLSKTLLLLSEREADAILTLLLRDKEKRSFQFVHLSDIRRVQHAIPLSTSSIAASSATSDALPALTAFLMLLFNGDTCFPAGSTAAATMHSVLQGNVSAQLAALQIPVFRGNGHMVTMSNLEDACLECK